MLLFVFLLLFFPSCFCIVLFFFWFACFAIFFGRWCYLQSNLTILVPGSLRSLLLQSCLTLAVSWFWLVGLLFLNKQVQRGNSVLTFDCHINASFALVRSRCVLILYPLLPQISALYITWFVVKERSNFMWSTMCWRWVDYRTQAWNNPSIITMMHIQPKVFNPSIFYKFL